MTFSQSRHNMDFAMRKYQTWPFHVNTSKTEKERNHFGLPLVVWFASLPLFSEKMLPTLSFNMRSKTFTHSLKKLRIVLAVNLSLLTILLHLRIAEWHSDSKTHSRGTEMMEESPFLHLFDGNSCACNVVI